MSTVLESRVNLGDAMEALGLWLSALLCSVRPCPKARPLWWSFGLATDNAGSCGFAYHG